MKIEFVEAPPAPRSGPRSKTRRPKHYSIARQLKARPGEWALIFRDRTVSTPGVIRKGGMVAFRPAGAFEAVSRSNGKGKVDVYAKYVGTPAGSRGE
jgi:hypothetical protein